MDLSVPEAHQPVVEYILWRAFLRVKSHEKALKLLGRLATQLHQALGLRSCKPYWKELALFEANFVTRFRAHTVEDMTFSALLTGQKLAATWSVTGPVSYSSDKWELRAFTQRTAVSGIEWIEFEVRNFGLPPDISSTVAAEHPQVSDAVLRPQDRVDFESWIHPDTRADL